MNLGYCPTCKAEFDIGNKEDKTYTTDCVACGGKFSYCVKKGVHVEYPPKIADIQVRKKRQGETGAYKTGDNIPVIK